MTRTGRAAGEHRDLAILEIVDEADFKFVRVAVGRNLVDIAVKPRACAAEQHARLV
jgi:hypothetical protein